MGTGADPGGGRGSGVRAMNRSSLRVTFSVVNHCMMWVASSPGHSHVFNVATLKCGSGLGTRLRIRCGPGEPFQEGKIAPF